MSAFLLKMIDLILKMNAFVPNMIDFILKMNVFYRETIHGLFLFAVYGGRIDNDADVMRNSRKS